MQVDYQVLKRFFEGNGNNDDKEKILDWFSDIESEDDLRKKYYRYWNELTLKPDLNECDVSIILGRIYHDIKLEESAFLGKKMTMNRIINIVSKIAAILLIPIIAFLFAYRNHIIPSSSEISYSKIYSPLGTRAMFYLPDGSNGWLNGGSYLEFPVEFKGKSREVMLRGEAYFDIAPDSKKPFIVSGTNIEVVAYGTSFNIQAYPEDQINKVALVSGDVKVSGKRKDGIQIYRIIKPGQLFTYDLSTSSCNIISADVNKIVSWKDGRLVFKNEPFTEVVRKINRWYNVNIVIKDEILESYTYLATFEDETLDEVLKLLELSAPIQYKDIGREKRKDGTFEKRKIELHYKP